MSTFCTGARRCGLINKDGTFVNKTELNKCGEHIKRTTNLRHYCCLTRTYVNLEKGVEK
jgi:hypothetical protein